MIFQNYLVHNLQYKFPFPFEVSASITSIVEELFKMTSSTNKQALRFETVTNYIKLFDVTEVRAQYPDH